MIDAPLLVTSLNECLYQSYRFQITMTSERLATDCRIHNVDFSVSHLAFEAERPVGVTLVGRRGDRAWIAGMGVHPAYRGRGLGTELMRRTQDRLSAVGVRSVFLEVLVENEVARGCYTAAGFIARRRLSCFRGAVSRIPWGRQASRIVTREPALILGEYAASHSVEACWQRDLNTLTSRRDELRGLVAMQGRRAVASLLSTKNAVADVGWYSAGPPLDRPLNELLMAAFGASRRFVIVNVPTNDPLHAALREGGFEIYAEQLDMRCDL